MTTSTIVNVAEVRAGLKYLVVASIGPTTSEELRQEGIPSLVREAAERSADLIGARRP